MSPIFRDRHKDDEPEDVLWPGPAPDPNPERGENLQTHLLPNLERLRSLSPDERAELVGLVADWVGPLVEEFRESVAAL